MWIRTQDKMRLIPNPILIVKLYDSNWLINAFKNKGQELPPKIVGDIVDEVNNVMLGSYATKERALEVLDEIQEYVNGFTIEEVSDGEGIWNRKFPTSNVYEMPKD